MNLRTPPQNERVVFAVQSFRLTDIISGILSNRRLSREELVIAEATNSLAARMQDRSQPTMLCMSCEHEFAHNEAPTEVAVCLPLNRPDLHKTASPICAKCAAADDETKMRRLRECWQKALPPDTVAVS